MTSGGKCAKGKSTVNVHLVDGTYELFRAYYGAPGAKSPAGQEVGATRGFLRSMIALLAEPGVTHVAVAFDHVIESFRNELFDGYKTGAGIEPELWAQAPLVEEGARALGLAVWPMVEFEADDALAAGAQVFGQDPAVTQVVLCSPDKDLAQCVSTDRVVMLDRKNRRTLNEDAVVEKFGVEPASIPDYLALVGDAADGIPGVPKWGAKSTATVLARYGHLESIPDDESAWDVQVRGAKGLAENLRAQREKAMLYRRLATLRTDVPMPALDSLLWRGADVAALTTIAEKLGDRNLVARAEGVVAS